MTQTAASAAIRHVARALSHGSPAATYAVIYVFLVVVNSQSVSFSKPFSSAEIALAMVVVLAWVVFATALTAALATTLFSRIGGVFTAFLTTALWTLPLASMTKLALLGQPLTATELGFFVRYTGGFTDPLVLGTLAAIATLTTLVAWWLKSAAAAPPMTTDTAKRVVAVVVALALAATAVVSTSSRSLEFAMTYMPEVHWLVGTPDRDLFVRYERLDLSDHEVTGAKIGSWQAPAGWQDKEQPNVIIIMIDGVRHAHLGVGGGRAGVTPNIDELANESLVFSHAYTPSTHSDYAQTAFLSGLHPRKFRGHDYFTEDYPRALVWDVLRPLGYKTGVFSTHNENWGDMLKFLKTPNVDVFKHAPDWPNAPKKGRGSDTAVPESFAFEDWVRWRKATPGRHLSYLNFQVTHFPYTLPPGAKRPFTPSSANFNISFVRYPRAAVPVMKNRFHNALHHADKWVGEVVRFVKAQGEWDNTVVIIASDHGEAFYEHDQPTHGTSLFQEQVESVLIARLPGAASRTVDSLVSLVDAMPSLLDHLGLPRHPAMQGRSWIFRRQPPVARLCETRFFTIQGLVTMDGAINCQFKIISDVNRRTIRCYDLIEDPDEKRDLWANGSHEQCQLAMGTLVKFVDHQTTYYDRKLWRKGWYAAPLSALERGDSKRPAPPPSRT